MAGINFNPQPMNNWSNRKPGNGDSSKQAPKPDDINDFMQTEQGKAFLVIFNKNRANQPQPDANGKRL